MVPFSLPIYKDAARYGQDVMKNSQRRATIKIVMKFHVNVCMLPRYKPRIGGTLQRSKKTDFRVKG